MIRKAFKMYLKAGCADEYEKRHNELWPEMKAMICLLYTSDAADD